MKQYIFYLVFTILLGQISMAQWDKNPQGGKLVGSTLQNDISGKMVSDGAGGAIFFWMVSMYPNSGSGYSLRYNKVDAMGNLVWLPSESGIPLFDELSNYCGIEDVVSDGQGGAFVVYYHNYSLFVQHIGCQGQMLFPETGVFVTDNVASARVSKDGIGGAVVVWNYWRYGFDVGNCLAQRFDASGTKQWGGTEKGIQLVNHNNPNSWENPIDVIPDENGNIIFYLNDARNCTPFDGSTLEDNMDIYAQKLDINGKFLWNKEGVPVCTMNKNQRGEYIMDFDKLVSDGAGGAYFAWYDYRNDPSNYEAAPLIYMQRLNEKGERQWASDGLAICQELTSKENLALFQVSGGGTAITWGKRENEQRKFIYAQQLGADGNVLFQPGGIEVIGYDRTYRAQISYDGSELLLGFDYNNDIYAQKLILMDGSLPWGEGKIVNNHPKSDQRCQSIVTTPDHGAILLWIDNRNSDVSLWDVYANKIESDGTLPLHLISFNAILQEKAALLQWKTHTDLTIHYFDVERSLDGTAFHSIGKVPADGNVSGNYNFMDNLSSINNPGIHMVFYRLHIIGSDGSSQYSAIRIVNLPSASSRVTVVPNPVKDEIWVQIVAIQDGPANISWMDIAGRTLGSKQITLYQGDNKVRVDLTTLPSGMYRLKVQTCNEQLNSAFIKQ